MYLGIGEVSIGWFCGFIVGRNLVRILFIILFLFVGVLGGEIC